MSTKDIWLGTMKFNWLKLALGLGLTLGATILLIIFCLIGGLAGIAGIYIAFLIWSITVFAAYRVIDMYIGYMLKSAHIACIATAAKSGKLPENMLETGKELVKKRFVSTNVYIGVDKLVNGAVKQVQKLVGKIGNLLNFIPGMENVTEIIQKFIGIFLGYIDECCLAWTFINENQNAWKSACDGVGIYFQNAKTFLKEAVKVTAVVVIGQSALTILITLMIMGLFGLFNIPVIAALIIAALAAGSIKTAFIDSWVICDLVTKYVEVAPQTELNTDLYGKLCNASSKFKEMYSNATNTKTESSM